MQEEPLPKNTEVSGISELQETTAISASGMESVNLHLIGSRRGVTRIIQSLHALGFIDASAWSRLISTKKRGQVISVATRYVSFKLYTDKST